jgi:hypothetical protein
VGPVLAAAAEGLGWVCDMSMVVSNRNGRIRCMGESASYKANSAVYEIEKSGIG